MHSTGYEATGTLREKRHDAVVVIITLVRHLWAEFSLAFSLRNTAMHPLDHAIYITRDIAR